MSSLASSISGNLICLKIRNPRHLVTSLFVSKWLTPFNAFATRSELKWKIINKSVLFSWTIISKVKMWILLCYYNRNKLIREDGRIYLIRQSPLQCLKPWKYGFWFWMRFRFHQLRFCHEIKNTGRNEYERRSWVVLTSTWWLQCCLNQLQRHVGCKLLSHPPAHPISFSFPGFI